ncbi:MAG: LssY C-terminal domain-containing protein [Acidobacteriia bacterium]|nr:LssY C-terminal domain-containing protein [Terriglobia bacterium]
MLTARLSIALLAVAIAFGGPLAQQPPAAIPVTARLVTLLSSYRSRAGDEVKAEIASAVCFDGAPLPPKTTLEGSVERVHAVGFGIVHETASLGLHVDRIVFDGGRSFPVKARLAAIENARERVDQRGVIHGIRATDTLSSRFSSRLFFAAHAHPAVMIPSLAVESVLFRFPEPEIEYAAGTELELEVNFPDDLGHAAACPQPAPAQEDAAEWQEFVASLPAWTYSKRQPQPMDPINLVFLGSLAELARAFRAAGWTGSDANSLKTGFEAIRAIVEDREYSNAPMRTLLLDGAAPDLRLQRSLNTFDKRDHMRIWHRDAEWRGRDVWAAAATKDVEATFSTRPFGFTHRIESDVDLERDKVVRELEFTGCVETVVRPSRLKTAEEAETKLRRGVETDSRVAVVLLNSCERQRELSTSDSGIEDPTPSPSLETRLIRRVTLTARNHFLRDNLIWRAGDTLRLGWHTFQRWEAQRREREARQMN